MILMKYISTRGGINPVSFSDSVLMGLANDGGLLLPSEIPDVSANLADWRKMSFVDLAFAVMSEFTDLPHKDLRAILSRSYLSFRHPEITPLVSVGNIHVLELFHGPTLAFKDVALQFLGNLFEYLMKSGGLHLNILGATSGDTGSAAIAGIKGRDRIRIFVLHPHGRTSKTQELQMTTVLDENVHNIAVDGTFDDCQMIVKSLFNDLEFKSKYALGSINSINWARLLAQVVYYFYAAFRAMDITSADRVSFSVPTGNFGDIFAGYMAARMGLPVEKLVLATNENDILSRFFQTGVYIPAEVQATISPSMDIQVASNFERYLYYKLSEDSGRLRDMMNRFESERRISLEVADGEKVDDLINACSVDTVSTLRTIGDFYNNYGYLLDPHSAVGVCAGVQNLEKRVPMICLATAHAAKFSQAIIDAVGKDIAKHPLIDGLAGLPTRCLVARASVDEIRSCIEAVCNKGAND